MPPRGIRYSLLLHFGLILVMVFGFPVFFDEEEPEPMVLTVEVLPISALTNLPPSEQMPQKQEDKQKDAPLPKPTPKPPEPKKPEPPKPEPKPEPKPDDVPDPTKKEKPKEPEKPEKPKPKETEKPEKVKPKEQPKDEFEELLKNLDKDKSDAKSDPKTPDKSKTATSPVKAKSSAPYNPNAPLSISERDAIRSQFIKCWTMPAGSKNAHELAVKIRVIMNQDGTVQQAGLVPSQTGRYQSDPFFKAAADSALRAVKHPNCNPLKNLTPEKYGTWKDMELNFDPSELY